MSTAHPSSDYSQSRLVILDRDGVINEDSDNYIKSADEWIPIPQSIEAIARLSKAGFTVAVATNQSGLNRGLFDLDDLEAMHAKLSDLVLDAGGDLAGIFYCPHTPDEGCLCRKPKSGLIAAIEDTLGLSAENAYLIGDSQRDLEAGLNKHCIPVLVKTGKGLKTLQSIKENNDPRFNDLLIFDDLASAADHLIHHVASSY